ncbi:uncharacterized protein LOC143469101 [Clavelina lepadiformis]|uniref:Uncharacterized protein n=1 Tax=Clavelina lepadiformis TaxID=159417 RepID=A0ABP0F9M9_CLALP
MSLNPCYIPFFGPGLQLLITETARAIAAGIRPEVERQTGQKYTTYEPERSVQEIITRTKFMYFITVAVGNGAYIRIQVLWTLDQNQKLTLERVWENLSESDPVQPK